MKSFFITLSIALTCSIAFAQSVAVNNDGSVAHTSAALDIKSTTKGLLIPRLTTAERTAVAAPAKGLLVFDTNTSSFWFFDGTAWSNLAANGGSGFTLPYAGSATSASQVFSVTNNGKGAAIYGRNDGGKAAQFVNFNVENIDSNLIDVVSYGRGNGYNVRYGNAASFAINNPSSLAAAVRASVNAKYSNFGAAAILAEASGPGGYAGQFYASNPDFASTALAAGANGKGNAIKANAINGNGVESTIDGAGTGTAIIGQVYQYATGRAGKFEIYNESNNSDVITVTTVGNGIAGNFKVDQAGATMPAVRSEVTTNSTNFGAAGVYGRASGYGGFGGVFHTSNLNGSGTALVALAEGNGTAIEAQARKNGHGLNVSAYGTGHAIFAWLPTTGQGKVARFANFNGANNNTVMTVESGSTVGNLVEYRAGSPYTHNVARINGAGKAFFNGGTQNSGADLAEAFDVTGDFNSYAPGDVLVISTTKDRAVERSSEPYSTLVAGVYATKPGVLLTEENIDNDLTGKVPMGVVGVIPTKVCLEGGAIKRGDMLVTSSLPGVAMKADIHKVLPGQVIGKALQDFNAGTTSKINVLVNVK